MPSRAVRRAGRAWIGPAGSRYSAQVLHRQAAAARATLALAAGLLVARFAALYDPHLIVDDAYISFRYADNLARGLGLVYNPGERVEGYSNFLWTLLLAGGARLGLDVVRLSVVLALGAFLVAAHDNVSQTNVVVKFVLNVADAIDGPFSRDNGIFSFHGTNAATKDAVVNWGIAALVYLAIGRYLQRLLAPRS